MSTTAIPILKPSPMNLHGQPPQEFWDLVERYRSDLINQAVAILSSQEDAEDVAQETFCDAYGRRSELQGIQSLGAWLRQINRTNALDRLRKRRRDKGKSERKQREAPARSMTTGGFSVLEMRESVAKAIEKLPEELREVIVLRYWEHLTYDEIAARLKLPQITVRRRLFEACVFLYRHTNLKSYMAPSHGAPGIEEPRADGGTEGGRP